MGLSALLFFFLGWLLYNLGLIPVLGTASSTGPPIGEVYEVQNQVRRRGLSSLVWEESRKKTPVYHRDTLLTLEKSGARVKLQNDVELQLSQNTLVVLEAPQSRTKDAPIRLKFQRGNLRSRSNQDLVVENQEFTLHALSGSKVEIQSLGEDHFEISVEEGDATVHSNEEVRKIRSGELLQLEPEAVHAPLVRTEELKLFLNVPERVYTHELPLQLQATWQGEAATLEVLTPNEPIQSFSLKDLTELSLDLPEGPYTLRLREGSRLSEAQRLEVIRAPRIHLLSPRPRDRLLSGEGADFVWLSPLELQDYRVEIGGAEISKMSSKGPTHKRVSLQGERGRKSWGVVGVDRDGFEIPSLYRSPFYLAPALLEAPELKAPRMEPSPLRAPAKEKEEKDSAAPQARSFWQRSFQLALSKILPSALAKNVQQPEPLTLIFEWTQVEGADFYTVEISQRADFHSLILEAEVDTTQWKWTSQEKGEVYWRVAGGSRAGAMGRFSEPERLNLDDIRKNLNSQPSQITPFVKVEKPKLAQKKEPAAPPPAPVLEPEPEAPAAAAEPERPAAPRQPYYTFSAGLRGSTHQLTIHERSSEGVQTHLEGAQPFGLELYGRYHMSPRQSVGLRVRTLPQNWRETYSEEKLTWTETQLSLEALLGPWKLAADHFQSVDLLRSGPQSQSPKSLTLWGLRTGLELMIFKRARLAADLGHAAGAKSTGEFYAAAELSALWPWSPSLSVETGVGYRHLSREGDRGSREVSELRVFFGFPLQWAPR